jgi:hypothetical protein
MSAVPVVVRKDMGITHGEFLRLLPRALNGTDFARYGNEIVLADGGRTLTIHLGPESERRIALMRIATTAVTLTFEGYAQADIDAFLARFDRAYQRGGG